MQTYWNNNGKYQALADQLQALIPDEGECPATKPLLEKFRRAANCYYDLYNNGLCTAEFRVVFGFAAHYRGDAVSPTLAAKLEVSMNRIILMAAAENLSEQAA